MSKDENKAEGEQPPATDAENPKRPKQKRKLGRRLWFNKVTGKSELTPEECAKEHQKYLRRYGLDD